MKRELAYDYSCTYKNKASGSISNVSYRNVILVLSLIVTVAIAYTGLGELSKAQTDDMSMNPIIMHIHPQLSLIVNGTPVVVPPQIGIDPSLWQDHSLDEFGMQSMPERNMSAMAPLHTHDDSGIVHVESTVNRDYTLGEFLSIWGLNLDGKTVKMLVDDKPSPEFRDHILGDGEQIRLEVQ